MRIALALFGHRILDLEIGRLVRVVPEGSTFVHLGTLTELSVDADEGDGDAAPEGRLSYGFRPTQ